MNIVPKRSASGHRCINKIWSDWTHLSTTERCNIYLFTPCISKKFHTRIRIPTQCVFILYFSGITHLLVEETNRYYSRFLDSLDDGPSPLPDVTDSEMFLFLRIQMGHAVEDRPRDCWSTAEQFLTPSYSNPNTTHFIGFEIFTAVVMKNTAFWDITPCSPVKSVSTDYIALYARR